MISQLDREKSGPFLHFLSLRDSRCSSRTLRDSHYLVVVVAGTTTKKKDEKHNEA